MSTIVPCASIYECSAKLSTGTGNMEQQLLIKNNCPFQIPELRRIEKSILELDKPGIEEQCLFPIKVPGCHRLHFLHN
jgi:hypothetical protein